MRRRPQILGAHEPAVPETREMCVHTAWGVCMLVHRTISNQTSLQAEQEAQEPGVRQATGLGQTAENSESELLKNLSLT